MHSLRRCQFEQKKKSLPGARIPSSAGHCTNTQYFGCLNKPITSWHGRWRQERCSARSQGRCNGARQAPLMTAGSVTFQYKHSRSRGDLLLRSTFNVIALIKQQDTVNATETKHRNLVTASSKDKKCLCDHTRTGRRLGRRWHPFASKSILKKPKPKKLAVGVKCS